MKKNLCQIITSGLCIILLVIIVVQGKKLDELSQKLDSKVDNLRYEVQGEISNITNIVRSELEELDRVILNKELKPMGIDKTEKKLLANATVNLKEWQEDTEVILYVTIGKEKLPVEMMAEGNGVFSAEVALPCETDAGNVIELDALISGGGLTRKESLGAWGDISMLLPLRSDGAGWSGPTYQNGVMSSHFSISVTGQNGAELIVNNPEFWIYRNGELAQQLKAVPATNFSSDGKSYTVDAESNLWSLACEAGDTVEIRFRCEDEYGLGYDFLFANWVAVEETETSENAQSAGASFGSNKSLVLYWPE